MRQILAAISRAIRAMSRAAQATIKKTIMMGGKLVTLLLPAGPPPIDELEPADAETPANDNVPMSEYEAIRALAYAQITGRVPTPQMLGAVSELQADWLANLNAKMAMAVVKASDADLRAHLQGRKALRGVLWCDAAAIDDYVTAEAIHEERRKRDALERAEPAYAGMKPA